MRQLPFLSQHLGDCAGAAVTLWRQVWKFTATQLELANAPLDFQPTHVHLGIALAKHPEW